MKITARIVKFPTKGCVRVYLNNVTLGILMNQNQVRIAIHTDQVINSISFDEDLMIAKISRHIQRYIPRCACLLTSPERLRTLLNIINRRARHHRKRQKQI